MRMRTACTADYENLKNLWREAFEEEESFLHAFFYERIKPENILILEDSDEKLISMLYMLPCILETDKERLSAVNVVGVATSNAHRNKGYMRKLINYSFEIMTERKVDAAFLKPSNKAFYEQFGFKESNSLYTSFYSEFSSEYRVFINSVGEELNFLIGELEKIYNLAHSAGTRVLRSAEDWKFNLFEKCVALSSHSYLICEMKDSSFVCQESMPVIRGDRTGCSMVKPISKQGEQICFNEENFIFEQY